MSAFKYTVGPNPGGGFTTRALRGTQLTEEVLLAQIATELSTTPALVLGVAQKIFDKMLDCGGQCVWSDGMFGRVSFRPTSGGSKSAPDGFHTAEDINANVSISLLSSVLRPWREGLTIESMGEVGKVSPEIDSIICQENLEPNHYVPGTMIEIRGNNLRLDKADVLQGVFFRNTAGVETRAVVYGTNDPGSLLVLVPSTLSGVLIVRVAAFINGSVRTTIATDTIS